MEKIYLYWYCHPSFLSDLSPLSMNTVIDWVYTYAMIANVSHCWVCMEFSVSTSEGLPWHIHAADVMTWDQVTHWRPQLPSWTVICTRMDTQGRTQYELYKPLVGYSVYDG